MKEQEFGNLYTRGIQEHGTGAMAKHMGAYCMNGDARII